MLSSIRSKFILLGAILVVFELARTAISNQAINDLEKSASTSKNIALVIQRHMEGDMMHDAMRGDVMSSLYAVSRGNRQEAENARRDLDEHYKNFSANIDANLNGELPPEIKEVLSGSKKSLDEYAMAARNVIDSGGSMESAASRLPRFNEKFSAMEKANEEISDKISNYAKAAQEEASRKADKSQALLFVLTLITVALCVMVPVFAVLFIFRPQQRIIESMRQVSSGNLTHQVADTERNDEIGEMAKAVAVFRSNAVEKAQLEEQREAHKQEAENAKRKVFQQLSHSFEGSVKRIVDIVAQASAELNSTSANVSTIASESSENLSDLSSKVGNVASIVQAVASATGELTLAIQEISNQVHKAANVTSLAVTEASKADSTVQNLVTAATRIGEVTDMINNITGQINLLALNATIESARAGEAGKGFAVVASEIKNLASQTTQATGEIATYIKSIQESTGDTVSVIKNISEKISNINQISTAIAGAVEEQSVSTRSIASNIDKASHDTLNASQSANQVHGLARETSGAAKDMLSATSELSQQASRLSHEVNKYMHSMLH